MTRLKLVYTVCPMKITDVKIGNFRSLWNVSLEELGNFIVLIGENGSGKTNILEILDLFFKDFSIAGGDTSPILNDASSWFGKLPRRPIEVTMTLELDEEECKEIFQNDELLKIMEEKYAENYKKLSICRQVIRPGKAIPWATKYMRWGGLDLVKNDTLLAPDQLNKFLGRPTKKPAGPIKAYFFHAQAEQPDFTKPRLIVLGKNAYLMNQFTDSLVRDKKVNYKIVPDIDYTAWVAEKKLTLTEKPPTRKELDLYLPSEVPPIFTAEVLQKITTRVQNNIKKQFTLIPANRDVKTTPGKRQPFIDKKEIIDPFCNLTTTDDPIIEEKLAKLKEKIKRFIPHDLDLAGKMRVWERDLRIPVGFIGGGQQEIIGLMWQIYSSPEGSMIAIEEPEIHLHPDLSRELFNLLKEDSTERQIWLVTHYPLFIDQDELKNNWKIWKKGKKTIVKKVERKEEIKEMLNILGARPSDRLYPNKVLLACETERVFLSSVARNMGYKLNGVLIPLASDLDKRKIKMTWEFVKDTQTPLILVIDKHGEKVAEDAKAKGWVEEDNCFILKDSIEDYYPKDLLVKALKRLFNVTDVEEKDLEKPTVEAVQRIKGVPGKGRWKIPIAVEVADQWTEKIHPEILKIIKKLANK